MNRRVVVAFLITLIWLNQYLFALQSKKCDILTISSNMQGMFWGDADCSQGDIQGCIALDISKGCHEKNFFGFIFDEHRPLGQYVLEPVFLGYKSVQVLGCDGTNVTGLRFLRFEDAVSNEKSYDKEMERIVRTLMKGQCDFMQIFSVTNGCKCRIHDGSLWLDFSIMEIPAVNNKVVSYELFVHPQKGKHNRDPSNEIWPYIYFPDGDELQN